MLVRLSTITALILAAGCHSWRQSPPGVTPQVGQYIAVVFSQPRDLAVSPSGREPQLVRQATRLEGKVVSIASDSIHLSIAMLDARQDYHAIDLPSTASVPVGDPDTHMRLRRRSTVKTTLALVSSTVILGVLVFLAGCSDGGAGVALC